MIRGVDCAFPQPSYPSWATIVCGYAGGHTQHQWTAAEVQAVRSSGRVWLAIWTARNAKGQPPLIGADGVTDAEAMAKQLPTYGYSHTLPVFYDIEPGIYDLNPTGAQAAIAQWKTGMHAAGYPNAYVYTIRRQDGDWIADWTNTVPAFIPPGKVGVQYGGDASFDYNVFIDTLLGDPVTAPKDWDDTDDLHVRSLVAAAGQSTGQDLIDAARQASDDSKAALVALGALSKAVADLTTLVKSSPALSGKLSVTGELDLAQP